jgi:hypothetical protein
MKTCPNDRPTSHTLPPSWVRTRPARRSWPSSRVRAASSFYVGDVVEATETDDGLAIKGRFDLDTEFGKSAYETPRAAGCQV